jgi:hypothetical protein
VAYCPEFSLWKFLFHPTAFIYRARTNAVKPTIIIKMPLD